MVHQVHLKQNTFSLATQLRSQQQVGEMADTSIICSGGERVFPHCALLATHWVWAYLVRGLESGWDITFTLWEPAGHFLTLRPIRVAQKKRVVY